MISLLTQDEKYHWAKFFEVALQLYDENNFIECARKIKSGSGGMGSLNDLVLGQGNNTEGKFQWKAGYKEINHRYGFLLNELYDFSNTIIKNLAKKTL